MKMLGNLFLLVLFLVGNSTILIGQRDCQTMENLKFQKIFHPEIDQDMQEIERFIERVKRTTSLRSEQTIVIPVVIHVLYNKTSENISLALIQSQLQVLNEDFQRKNANRDNKWKQAASVNIEFRLATHDPQGNATSGIIRKFTNKAFFYANNDMKSSSRGGSNAWPREHYLNIWVCNLHGGKMGYAQFPGGGSDANDGVVVDFYYFGKTNRGNYGLGRTCVHEVGHWLGLRHIWGDGDCNKDDHVDDTPLAGSPSYGCQEGKATCGSRDMVQNYMDYSYDGCMNLFTFGQKHRMRAHFEEGGFRASLLNSIAFGSQNEDTSSEEEEEEEEEETDNESDCPNDNCDTEEEEGTCAKPTDLKASIQDGALVASWTGNAGKYVFELMIPGFNRWYSFNLSKTRVEISNIRDGKDYKARLKSICADGTESTYAYFDISTNGSRFGDPAFEVFPNPTSGILNLRWGNLLEKSMDSSIQHLTIGSDELKQVTLDQTQAGIRVMDTFGRNIIEQNIGPGMENTELQLGSLQSGIYLIQLRTASGRLLTKRVVLSPQWP